MIRSGPMREFTTGNCARPGPERLPGGLVALIFSASLVLKAGVKQGAVGPGHAAAPFGDETAGPSPDFRGQIAVDRYDPGKGVSE
jgi:hypothetical protein